MNKLRFINFSTITMNIFIALSIGFFISGSMVLLTNCFGCVQVPLITKIGLILNYIFGIGAWIFILLIKPFVFNSTILTYLFPLGVLTSGFIFNYFLSCLIIFIYNKIKSNK